MLHLIDKPVPWPNGAKVAASITFDIDMDSILHLAMPETSHRKVAAQQLLLYDRIAVKRIVDVFDHFGIKQTFFFPAWCMEQHPELVEYILKSDHEIAHHGYLHESPNAQKSLEDERYWLQRGSEVIKHMTGKAPRGWRAPVYDFSEYTTDLLAEEGFLYDASLMGDDVPYVLKSKAGQVIEIPSNMSLDDWGHYAYFREFGYRSPVKSPDEGTRVCMAEYEAAWKYGGCWIPVWHPSVSGRLSKLDRMITMIEEILDKGDVWFATMEEIALHVNKCRAHGSYEPRIEPMPTYSGPFEKSLLEVPG